MWVVLSDVLRITGYIGVLVLIEGLLSADNALVLAVMVRHLPVREQRRVLRLGIWGAVGFRFIAVLMSSVLLSFWYCKVAGGVYLLYLALKHFLWEQGESVNSPAATGNSANPGSSRTGRSLWGIVTSVTLADIAFSIDSILAAVAMADSFPYAYTGKLVIVYVGGVLGIITMRFVVRYFVILLNQFPSLAEGAYYLVAWIGLKLAVNGFHDADLLQIYVPELLFWFGMAVITAASLVIKPGPSSRIETDVAASLDLLDEEQARADEGQTGLGDDPQEADAGRGA